MKAQILRSSRKGEIPPYFPGWLKERFGAHFAQISTDTTLRMRSAVKDIARMRLGAVPEDVEQLAKNFRNPPQGMDDLKFILGYETEEGERILGSIETGHSGTDEALLTYKERYPEDYASALKALGLPRSKSRHAAAFLISQEPVSDFIPMMSVGDKETRVTAFTAASVEAMGGLKVDFLVVKCIKDIEDCVRLVQDRHVGKKSTHDISFDEFQEKMAELKAADDPEEEPSFPRSHNLSLEAQEIDGQWVTPERLIPLPNGKMGDIYRLPSDDLVYRDIMEGRVETVFQLNTPAAMKWMENFRFTRRDGTQAIRSLADIANFTALDRPGPLDYYVRNPDWTGDPDDPKAKHNMLVEFARRLRGYKPSPDVPPALDEIAKETLGIMVYQETLTQVFQELSGCDLSVAEEFRSHVSKKKNDLVEKDKVLFLQGAIPKLGEEQARDIFKSMQTWSNYGFCIDGDQEIVTDKGLKAMRDITTSDKVSDGYFFHHPVKVWKSGQKEVLEVTLEDNTTVRATADHRFLYREGWISLKDLIDHKTFETKRQIGPIKILSFRSLGIKDVYDMEMPNESFLLANGAIAHNCKAHAYSYAAIAYTTAYLKHHYPLEWWCAVLRNADKEKINEKLWKYCAHLVEFPDITQSAPNWEIQGDKIRAPLGVLEGVGPMAHNQICKYLPYTSIEDFAQKIQKHRVDNSFPRMKMDKKLGKEVEVMSLGRNNISRTTVYKLIVAGVFKSFFPENATVKECLAEYDAAMLKHYGKTYKTSMKKTYPTLDPLGRYQTKKLVLPIFGADLRKEVIKSPLPEYIKVYEGTRWRFAYTSKWRGKEKDLEDPIVGFTKLEELATTRQLPEYGIKCAVIAHVDERTIGKWGPFKANERLDLTLDVGGGRYTVPGWPPQGQNKLPDNLLEINKGDIGVFLLARNNPDRGFSIRDFRIIRKAIDQQEENAND